MFNPLKNVKSRQSLKFLLVGTLFSLAILICISLLQDFKWFMDHISNGFGKYVIGAAIYYFAAGAIVAFILLRYFKELVSGIKGWRMFGCFFGLRVVVFMILPSLIFGDSLPRLLASAFDSEYVILTDMETIQGESGTFDGDRETPSFVIGSVAIVVRKSIDKHGIKLINRELREYNSGIQIRKANGKFWAYFANDHDGGALRNSPCLFWQVAVCNGFRPEPAKDFPDYNSWYFFKICPFSVLEFLILEIPCSILMGLFLWFLRGYIAPDLFSGNSQESASEDAKQRNNEAEINAKGALAYESGLLKSQKQDFAGAILDFDKAIKLEPKKAIAFYNRGIAKSKVDDHKGAIRDFSSLIKLEPDSLSGYFHRAVAKTKVKDHKGARIDFGKAIDLDPTLPNLYYNRGVTNYELKDDLLAVEDFTKAIALNANHTGAIYNRGLAHYGLAKYESAIEDLTRVIEIDPNHTNAYYQRGLIHLRGENKYYAKIDFKKAAELGHQKASQYLKSLSD